MITRNTIAILLETRPNNIKSLKQVGNDIYIKLGDLDDELSMTIQEYQSCSEQLRRNKKHINIGNFVSLTMIIGAFMATTVSAINIDLAEGQNSSSPTQLMSDSHQR